MTVYKAAKHVSIKLSRAPTTVMFDEEETKEARYENVMIEEEAMHLDDDDLMRVDELLE